MARWGCSVMGSRLTAPAAFRPGAAAPMTVSVRVVMLPAAYTPAPLVAPCVFELEEVLRTVGGRLRTLRHATLDDISERSGISPSTLSRLESGPGGRASRDVPCSGGHHAW